MARQIDDILTRVRGYNPAADLGLLERAYEFSAKEHRDQKRRSGEPYVVHPVEVAYLLADLQLDTSSIAAGLLHDVVEDTLTTVENVADNFGDDVAHIVDGVTKISKLKYSSTELAEADNLRKMILAMIDDIRVILVKLADRLHNMRTLEHLAHQKRVRIARETREIYAPLANRLGIGKIKAELEDLSFRYLQPEKHDELAGELLARRQVSDRFIEEIREQLRKTLEEQGIAATISGRLKTIYSIYRKMQAQKIGVDQVYDYIAFRVITESVRDCYGVLGIIHSVWSPIPGRIKDYIAMPKANMYQSLHTSVMTGKGHPFEVQIRTEQMHRIAEEGIAAHWHYKEGGPEKQAGGREADNVAWMRQILEWQQDLSDPRDFVNLMKVDLYPEEVYAFTPDGKVLSFRRGSTPIDFAYAVHTEVGHHTVGAKVNGKIVPLKYELQNGDIVEILTHPSRQPSRDWLSLAKTSRARSKIRSWLNTNERSRSENLGRELTEKEFRKYKLTLKALATDEAVGAAMSKLGYADLGDYFAAVGYGKTTPQSLLGLLAPDAKSKAKPDGMVSRIVKRLRPETGIKVSGMEDMMISLAKCCSPVRGEPIVGYISRGKGVSVHSTGCPNVAQLMYDSERRIDVEWTVAQEGELFDVKLLLDVEDTQGLLAKIVQVVADQRTNIKNVEAKTFGTDDAQITMVVAVSDLKQMERVLNRIRKIKGVRDVERGLS